MNSLFQLLGSLKVAVVLLIAIAGVLAWGTIYEVRFGTAAVQRFVYQAGWFQGLLAFLAINLAVAALRRAPWKRQHLPFVLAHIGIILILVGGILGGRFGIEGQLVIPEGEAASTLQLSRNVLVVHPTNPGTHHEFLTDFESTAWIHNPHRLFSIPLKDRVLHLVVDRYFPNASIDEEVTDAGRKENPAVHLSLTSDDQPEGRADARHFPGLAAGAAKNVEEEALWLFARDPDRFGVRWGEVHLLFLEPTTDAQWQQLLGERPVDPSDRGVIQIKFPDLGIAPQIPVPLKLNETVPVPGTPYRITFKDYFPDFALSEEGPISRSDQPNNPAVAFTLSGPEGTDAHLAFALHPDFPAIHGVQHQIHAHVTYEHEGSSALPPNAIGLLRLPAGGLAAVLTGSDQERERIDPVQVGVRYAHPWSGIQFEVTAYYPQAELVQSFKNLGNEVRRQALHVVAQDGPFDPRELPTQGRPSTAQAWLPLGSEAELSLGEETLRVEYRPGEKPIPFSLKLLDFRKIDYPGTQMAAGFESDVTLTDPGRGLTLNRTISMNNPLKYRGFSFFQSSYIPGIPETTILSVRNDPGTPLVYLGFIIVVLGVASMFILRKDR